MKTLKWALLFLSAVMIGSCGSRATSRPDDYDRPVYLPEYAGGFEIVGAEGRESTIVKIYNPWQGAENVEVSLFISRNGERPPAGFNGEILTDNPSRVVCMSSTHIAMLDAVGAVERIAGVSGIEYVSNEYVSTHKNLIGDVGYEGNVNYELLVSIDPDLVLLYGLNGVSGMESKLRELKIPFAYVGDYLEESPLGKAEWIVAVGEMVGRRAEAETVYAEIPKRYNELKKRVAETPHDTPEIMINTPYGDSWFMASATSYIAQAISDAGGRYIYERNTTTRSLPIDLEEAALLVARADLWLNVGSIHTLDELKRALPKFADARCVERGDVWNCDRRVNTSGGNDFWESGVVHPDVVLRDLIKIMHPELVPDAELVYYRRLE